MNYFVILLNARFGHDLGHLVKADRFVRDEEQVRFYREDRLAYQVPAQFVHHIEGFEYQADADEYLKEKRRLAAGANVFSIQEPGGRTRPTTPPRSGKEGGFLAESVSVIVEKKGR